MGGNYRVLTINGGGVRGIIPAIILKKLTDNSGKQINELFDYIVGTSIGGIIAASLTVSDENGKPKYTTNDIVDIMINDAQNIFPNNTIGNWPIIGPIHNLLYPKYSREGIDKLLDEKLGNATFSDTVMPITTVSYSLDTDAPRTWSTFKAQLDNTKYNYLLKDAAGATSAAPTYFPPKVTVAPNGEIYHDIDGGIFANSPTFLGISELVKAHPELDPHKMIVVSIGTGRFADKPIACDSYNFEFSLPFKVALTSAVVSLITKFFHGAYWKAPLLVGIISSFVGVLDMLNEVRSKEYGAIGWITSHDLISKMMKGTELSDAIESLTLFKSIRINPKLDEKFSAMDNSSPEHMQEFHDAVEMYIENHSKLWENVLTCLSSRDFHSVACAKAREEESKEEFQNIILTDLIDEFTLVDTSLSNSNEDINKDSAV